MSDILALSMGYLFPSFQLYTLITGFATKAQAFPEIPGPPRKIFNLFRGDEITSPCFSRLSVYCLSSEAFELAYEVGRKDRPENLTPREKVGGLAGKNAMVRRVCRRSPGTRPNIGIGDCIRVWEWRGSQQAIDGLI